MNKNANDYQYYLVPSGTISFERRRIFSKDGDLER